MTASHTTSAFTASGNLRAAGWMTGGMAMFALEDAAIKFLGARIGAGQIIAVIGLFGLLPFWLLLVREGGRLWTRDLLRPGVLLRNAGEALGTLCFVSALALADLSTVSAILQALPLALVLGAALFLGERIGPRRIAGITVALAGALIVIRPGAGVFQPAALLPLLAAVTYAAGAIMTRMVRGDGTADRCRRVTSPGRSRRTGARWAGRRVRRSAGAAAPR